MSYLSLNRQSKNSNKLICATLKIVITISVSLFISSCWKSEAEKLKEQIEVEKAKIELMAIQKQSNDAELAIKSQKKVVDDLEFGLRESLMKEGTKVLQLRNGGNVTANFTLKCFEVGGASRQFNLSISPGEAKEIGFQQGWNGNFVSGENCKVYYDDDFRWGFEVK